MSEPSVEETEAQRMEREAREQAGAEQAPAQDQQEQTVAPPPAPEAESTPEAEAEQVPPESEQVQPGTPGPDPIVADEPRDTEQETVGPQTDPAGTDLGTAGQSSAAGGQEWPNANVTSFARGEELFAAEQQLRGGTTPRPTYPEALPREQQEENLQAAAEVVARNMTGKPDGISTILPPVGGVTNLALTSAERAVLLDDAAVDAKGRLAGDYLDDRQEAEAARRREYIEGRDTGDEARSAAARVRALATSPAVSAADLGRPTDEMALVDNRKHTSPDGFDANDPDARRAARVDAEAGSPGASSTPGR